MRSATLRYMVELLSSRRTRVQPGWLRGAPLVAVPLRKEIALIRHPVCAKGSLA